MADPELGTLFDRARSGDPDAGSALFDALYGDLRSAASRIFRSQRRSHTLEATALVHEAYLRMARAGSSSWRDRTHFLAIAARAMRQVLVNHARDRAAAKRGGADRRRVTLSGIEAGRIAGEFDVLDLHEALEALEALDPRPARVAELRLFAGLEQKEIAESLGVSLRTVELDWRMAKDFLAGRLDPARGGAPDGA